jgi:hypothetical protein
VWHKGGGASCQGHFVSRRPRVDRPTAGPVPREPLASEVPFHGPMNQARSATSPDSGRMSLRPFAQFRRPALAPRAKRALKLLLFLPVALWLGYVVVVNIVLSTGLVARLVSYNPDDVTMHYESAWSVWPGVTHVKGFRVGGADSVLQWVVEVDEARVDIRLTELLRKKFHATKIRAMSTGSTSLKPPPPASASTRSCRAWISSISIERPAKACETSESTTGAASSARISR